MLFDTPVCLLLKLILIEPMQKSLCRNCLQREDQLLCVPGFLYPRPKLGLRPTEEREGKNCLGKIKRKRKERKKEGREEGRDGKVLIEALTLYRANPIPETKCTGTSMSRWLLISEHSLWPQTFSLLEKKPGRMLLARDQRAAAHSPSSGRGARFPPQPGTLDSVWLHFSKPQIPHKDFKNVPLQNSGVSRPELGSGWCNHTASAGDQDPNCPERRSQVSYGLFPSSTSN